MRRLLLLLTAGLAIATFGCSSSEEAATTTSTTAPTTTSSVVVSAANKPTCDAIGQFKAILDEDLGLPEGGDPAESAAKIQARLTALSEPLRAIEASAPADLKPAVTAIITGSGAIIALDPTAPADQQQIVSAMLAPSSETLATQKTFYSWSAKNCGITLG
jgi:hypothetical protein